MSYSWDNGFVRDDTTKALIVTDPDLPRDMGFAEITSELTTTATSYTDMTGLAISDVEVIDKPLEFTFSAPQGIESTVANDIVLVSLIRDSSVVRSGVAVVGPTTSRALIPFTLVIRDTPANGTYDYKLQWYRISGTGTIKLNATGSPFFTYPSLSCRELPAAT